MWAETPSGSSSCRTSSSVGGPAASRGDAGPGALRRSAHDRRRSRRSSRHSRTRRRAMDRPPRGRCSVRDPAGRTTAAPAEPHHDPEGLRSGADQARQRGRWRRDGGVRGRQRRPGSRRPGVGWRHRWRERRSRARSGRRLPEPAALSLPLADTYPWPRRSAADLGHRSQCHRPRIRVLRAGHALPSRAHVPAQPSLRRWGADRVRQPLCDEDVPGRRRRRPGSMREPETHGRGRGAPSPARRDPQRAAS